VVFGVQLKSILLALAMYDKRPVSRIKKPEYHEEGDFVKLIFYFSPSTEEGDNEEDIILKFITMRGEVSIGEITQLLDISRNTATRKLRSLLDKNLIVRRGRGPAVRYYTKESIIQ